MEGPSLYLAAYQLKSFKKKKVLEVAGNTKTDKDRIKGRVVKDIFAWGKHLVYQFDDFAVRIHFLLFGTFEATVNGKSVTGDYKRAREPRLAFTFENGNIQMFNCSVKFFEDAALKKTYDYAVDIMSDDWDPKRALKTMKSYLDDEIADILLDQNIFAGVGNIIKNEVLSIARVQPTCKISDIKPKKLKEIIEETHKFSHQFLAWRRKFVLRKNLKIHRRGTCPHCGQKVVRAKTGKRQRWSYYCEQCQVC